MTEGYIGTLFGFQICLISRSKFSNFVIFSASVLGRLLVKGTALSIGEHYIRSVEIYCFVSIDRHVQFKIMLADSNTGSGLYL
jgi:hypothetical protein